MTARSVSIALHWVPSLRAPGDHSGAGRSVRRYDCYPKFEEAQGCGGEAESGLSHGARAAGFYRYAQHSPWNSGSAEIKTAGQCTDLAAWSYTCLADCEADYDRGRDTRRATSQPKRLASWLWNQCERERCSAQHAAKMDGTCPAHDNCDLCRCGRQGRTRHRGQDVGIGIMHLIKTEPDANLHRFYRLEIVRGLFGDLGLVRNWGRIGSSGQQRTD